MPILSSSGSAPLTDDVLVRRAQCGDAAAFDVLFHRYERRVRAGVRQIVGLYQDIDDIAQNVWLSVLRHLRTFRNESSFSTWLHCVARNEGLQHLRRNKRDVNSSSVDDPTQSIALRLASPQPSAERALLARERATAIQDWIQELPANSRLAMRLWAYEDHGVEAIALQMGVSRQAVNVRLFRARRTLRNRAHRWELYGNGRGQR